MTTGSSGSGLLIKNAAVVTMAAGSADLADADIVVRNDVIAGVGPGLELPGGEVIDGSGMIAVPGFVDGHRHLWEGVIRGLLPDGTLLDYLGLVNQRVAPAYRPEDAYVGTLVSVLGALDAGVTTILDWSHIQNTPEHTTACLAALRDGGVRAVFAYGPGAPSAGGAYPNDLLRLAGEEFSTRNQLLTMGLATMSPEHAPYEEVTAHFELAREVDALVTLHAGLRGLGSPNQVLRLARDGLLGPHVNLVHANTLSAEEWRAIGDTGTTVSITPSTEMQMGQGIPPVQQAIDVGLVPSLGVDVETSAAGDLWTQMRLVFALQRQMAFEAEPPGEMPRRLLSTAALLDMVTRGGAAATRLGDVVGTLEVGKQGDIVLLRRDMVNAVPVHDLRGSVVHNMDARNVDTVVVGGRVRKRAGKLLDVDVESLSSRARESQARVLAAAGVAQG